MRERLAIVSAERIRAELSKLLVGERVEDALWMLVDTGLADLFLPELSALRLEQDPVHRHKDVLAHTIAVVGKTQPDLLVRMAALLHDIGKPKTRAIGPEGVSFHHHEVVGARMADERLRELRYPADFIKDVRQLVFLHLRVHTYGRGWTDRAVRRYVRDAGPLYNELNELVRCDCTTRNRQRAAALSARMDQLEERVDELKEREELDALRPALDGHEVMARLGIPPGRLVGAALDYLMEVRLDEGEISKEDAVERLEVWAAGEGLR
jgi:poly(A) polymerase